MKLGENNVLDPRLMRVILNNTRLPESMENDLLAQAASVRAAAEELQALFARYGAAMLLACFDALIDYSERRTRAESAAIPDGIYRHEEQVLDDGAKGGRIGCAWRSTGRAARSPSTSPAPIRPSRADQRTAGHDLGRNLLRYALRDRSHNPQHRGLQAPVPYNRAAR